MSNCKTVLAGSLWVAMLSGCTTETQTACPTPAPAPVAAAPDSRPTMPRLGAGDSLGRQIFSENRVASRPTIVNTASADAGE